MSDFADREDGVDGAAAVEVTRLDELLAGRAVGDLSFEERRELDQLLSKEGEDESYELAQAALELVLMNKDNEPMPDKLRSGIQSDAFAYFELERRGGRTSVATTTTGANVVSLDDHRESASRPPSRFGLWAVAACVALVGFGWMLRSRIDAEGTSASPTTVEDAVRWEARPGTSPAAAQGGSVVWRGGALGGELFIQGLRAAETGRYHVWMVRADQPATLVGVFDAKGVDEARVRLRPDASAQPPSGAIVTLQPEIEGATPAKDALVMIAGNVQGYEP